MHESLTSSETQQSRWIEVSVNMLTWIFRILVGATFVYSGVVKGIDPWGSYYKFGEYINALGLQSLQPLLISGVFALCCLEFLIGIFFLFGCYRKSSPWLAAIFMIVMLPLTLWIAIKNPVSDCGCFGDALLLTNWQTFWKNVLLSCMIIWLIRFNRRCITIISPAFQWIGVVVSILFMLTISFIGYLGQPLIDFRPYKTGESLIDATVEEDEEGDIIFIYEKEGIRKAFTIDEELPSEDEGWQFVERKEASDQPATIRQRKPEKTLRIWDRDGSQDITEDVISESNPIILLLIPNMSEVTPAVTWKINSIDEWIKKQGGEMFAVVSGSAKEIAEWEDLSMPDYDIYTGDDTAIKEVARGNPALVYLKNGVIVWKSSLSAIDVDIMSAAGKSYQPSVTIIEPKDTFCNILLLYLACMAVPVALTFIPRIKNCIGGKREISLHGSKKEPDSQTGKEHETVIENNYEKKSE